MQNSTLPDQPVAVKEKHPADGSDRWSVTGEAGKVVYDLLGNHLALIPTYGEIDSVMGTTLARTRDYAVLNEDDIVFGILRNLYHTELEFPGSGAVIEGEVVEVAPLAIEGGAS